MEIQTTKEEQVMLALIEAQTIEGSALAQAALEKRIRESSIDSQRLRLYNLGVVALDGDETEILLKAKYPTLREQIAA